MAERRNLFESRYITDQTKCVFPSGARAATLRRTRLNEVKEKHYITGTLRDEELHLLMIPIFKQYHFGYGDDMIHGLLVVRSFRRRTFFERIGIFFFPEHAGNEPGSLHAVAVEQEITVI